jgi:hypothetical protein
MRIGAVVPLISVVVLAGCQLPDGSVDWHRTALVAGRSVIAGGGLLLGGPTGAAAGLNIGSSLLGNTNNQSPAASAFKVRRRATPRSAPAPTIVGQEPAVPPEREAPKPAPTLPAATLAWFKAGSHAKLAGLPRRMMPP